jgi:hypothetical protein
LQWYFYDDTRSSFSNENIQFANAYLLFYFRGRELVAVDASPLSSAEKEGEKKKGKKEKKKEKEKEKEKDKEKEKEKKGKEKEKELSGVNVESSAWLICDFKFHEKEDKEEED